MTVIVDTGALYAQADATDPDHEAVSRVLREEPGPLVVPAFAAAEADHLILGRLGPDVELAFVDDLASGTYLMECLDRAELRLALDVASRYRDLRFGLTDASVVVLARRFDTNRIVTLDERDFRVVTPLLGGSFTILPADA